MTYHHNEARGIEQDDFILKWIEDHEEVTSKDSEFLAAYEAEWSVKFSGARLLKLFREGILDRRRQFGETGSSWTYVYRKMGGFKL